MSSIPLATTPVAENESEGYQNRNENVLLLIIDCILIEACEDLHLALYKS